MPNFSLKLDLAGLSATLGHMAAQCEEAARPAAQAGAQVLYDEVRKNVAAIKPVTGNLARSIYQAYSQNNSGQGVATYHVSWNAKKAPHGHLVEYGHLQRYKISYDPQTRRFTTHKDQPLATPRQVGARPFLRPAAAKAPLAQQAMVDRYLAELAARGITA